MLPSWQTSAGRPEPCRALLCACLVLERSLFGSVQKLQGCSREPCLEYRGRRNKSVVGARPMMVGRSRLCVWASLLSKGAGDEMRRVGGGGTQPWAARKQAQVP